MTALSGVEIRARNGPFARLGAWLSQERVFRWIPFVLVEGTFILVIIIPFLLTIYISFLRWRANRPFEQAYLSGFRNYEAVLSDTGFWAALGRTFYFAGFAVVFELVIGFVLAMLVHRVVRGRRIYITVFLIPMMVVPVVVGYNFSMIYIDHGPLNQLLLPLTSILGIDPRIRWLSDPLAAQWAIILADVWQWTSLTFLIFLSGFSALPAAAHQRRPGDGRLALADLLVGRAAAAQAGDRDRGGGALDGGVEAVRPGGAADLRRARHLDPDGRLLPVGAGLAVQQVRLRRGGVDAAADPVLDADLHRHLADDARAHAARPGARVVTPAAAGRAMAGRTRRRRTVLRHAVLIGWGAIIMFPIYWMIQTSFKDSGEWVTWPPNWVPQDPTLKNYEQVFTFDVQQAGVAREATEQPFNIWGSLLDSVLVCSISSLIALFMGTFLAYAISRFNVGGSTFRHMVLLVRMIPPIVIAIPLLMYYAIMVPFATETLLNTRISLFDTRTGVSALYTTVTLPFVIWMMLSFIEEVPYTLEHAARLMGAGRIYTLRKIVLPLVASGMVVTFLFVFILSWGEFLLALTLTHPDVSTLPVLLNKYQSASEGRLYGPQAAIGTVITVPVVIMGILIQKHLVKGFSFGMMRR